MKGLFFFKAKKFFFSFLLSLVFSQVQRSQCVVEALCILAHVFCKCQLCTHAHTQHSRHEVWDDKSEQKLKVLGVNPSVTIQKRFEGFMCFCCCCCW